MPLCNGVDISLNVTERESEQTSDWLLIAMKIGELTV